MQALPGMTPEAVWDLPQIEFIIVADFADRWADEQRRQSSRVERSRGVTRARR